MNNSKKINRSNNNNPFRKRGIEFNYQVLNSVNIYNSNKVHPIISKLY